MAAFEYLSGRLHAEAVDLVALAEKVGTPAYVYSRAAVEEAWRSLDDALSGHPHLVCYAVKANSNLAVLDVLARLGSGFDIVSIGELERVLAAGGRPERIVFSGVGKSVHELERALKVGIRCFNAESGAELEALNAVAQRLGTVAPVSLRVNPDVDAHTHPYIATGLKQNKFGVPIVEARAVYRIADALPHLKIVGVDCHIGSQLTSLTPIGDALSRVLDLVDSLVADGIKITDIDVGGGLGIRYRDEEPPSAAEYAATVIELVGNRELEIVLEPGRLISGNAGVLLTRVEYIKRNGDNTFAIVDAAMNDFLRPALYQAWCDIVPLEASEITALADADPSRLFDVVGPVCESGDFLGWKRPLGVAAGSYLAVLSAGAYGFVMSSNYNTRPRAPEVMVDGDTFYVSRPRETLGDLFGSERTLEQLAGQTSEMTP